MNGLKVLAICSGLALSLSIQIEGSARAISFSPNGDNNAGSLKCEVPVKSMGNLPLRNGVANISGRVITVKAASEGFESPHTVLAGSVLRSEANLASEPPSVTGLALFLMGDFADYIDDGKTPDLIFCKDKKQVAGRILGIEGESISVKDASGQSVRLPLGAILYIRSPRVFVFKIVLKGKQAIEKDEAFQAEAVETSFRPTSTQRTLSGSVIPQNQKKDDDLLGPISPILPGQAAENFQSQYPSMGTSPPGLSGANMMGGMGAFNSMGGMGRGAGMQTAVPDSRDNSFDGYESADRFRTVKGKWGTQKITVPPGMLD